MEVVHPGLDCVETDSFGYHVLAALASDVEGSFVSDFAASYSLSFDNFEGFFVFEVTFPDFHFVGIEVFGSVEVVCSCCSE